MGLALEYPGMDLKKFLKKEPGKARDQKLRKVRCPVLRFRRFQNLSQLLMKWESLQGLCSMGFHSTLEIAHMLLFFLIAEAFVPTSLRYFLPPFDGRCPWKPEPQECAD